MRLAPGEPNRPRRRKGDAVANDEPDALLVDDRTCAKLLGVSRATIHRMHAAGQFIPTVRIGRCLRFRAADVRSFVECGCDIVRWRGLQAVEGRRSARAM
jgi:excisionase family DNA binding protein